MTSPLVLDPAVRGDRVVFVSEDDLWSVSLDGGLARRLTSGSGRMKTPRLSPDGTRIAVSATEEGARDLYLLDADGGPLVRRTWLGSSVAVCGFDSNGNIVFTDNAHEPFSKSTELFQIGPDAGNPVPLRLGPAVMLDWSADGRRVLGRHTRDLAAWQRYRGGRVGQIWVESADEEGIFERLSGTANPTDVMWIGGRIWFLDDASGFGNLHSCAPDGSDSQRHTDHGPGVARFASHDDDTIVYVVSGDLWRFDVASGEASRVDVETRSQRTRTQLRFPTAATYLQGAALHPEGHSLVVAVRGKVFAGGHWEGPLLQLGDAQGVHHRLPCFMPDGERMVWAADPGGEDTLVLHDLATGQSRPLTADVGRPKEVVPGPDDVVAVTNHRNELHLVDVKTGDSVLLEDNDRGPVSHPSWSADGRWLAWTSNLRSWGRSKIRIAHVHELDVHSVTDVTEGRYVDHHPDFDPLGRFLYFLSDREFDPVMDGPRFAYSFPRGTRPYLVTLQSDTPSPFRPLPRDLSKPKKPTPPDKLVIELDGLADRVVRFPISDGRYTAIRGLPSGKVLVTRDPILSATKRRWNSSGPPDASATLQLWDYDAYELTTVHARITSFTLDHPRKTALVRVGNDLRVIPADPDKGTRAELKKTSPRAKNRKNRWIDLSRARLVVDPPAEWAQMLDESWRLMREHFWDAGMSGIDWDAVRERYRPLIERASIRTEVSDVLWCMNGELGTSHAYEMGGEYRAAAVRRIGRLGADVEWDGEAWRVTAIHRGDRGHPTRSSPLTTPGANGRVGTRIHSVNGQPVTEEPPLGALLMGHSNRPVILGLSDGDGPLRGVEVRPLADDRVARYRSWVARNREIVREATDGRAGYVHIPDMGPAGFADFHRDFLAESEMDALLVDVRWNRGGHVSQFLLGQLMQRRLAYSRSRWHAPNPYPRYAVLGPMVALTNELAGSDGDIFSQHWKTLGLGPLIGTRTWGGVIGISPRARLVDGTIVTQPEYANWMHGPGFAVENYGVDPDIEVVITPQDHHAGRDPQMDRALFELNKRIDEEDPGPPDFGPIPSTAPGA